jgi:hypothetical protein
MTGSSRRERKRATAELMMLVSALGPGFAARTSMRSSGTGDELLTALSLPPR